MRFFRSNKDSATDRSPGEQLKLPTIVAANIKSMADLDGPHFVFLVTFNSGEQIVLKAEMQVNSAQSIGSHNLGVRIMGFVSPVKAETLSEYEKQQVNLLDTGITKAFFTAERAIEAGRAHWVKAIFQSGLAGFKDYKSFEEKLNPDNPRDARTVDNPQKKAEATAYMAKLNQQLAGNTKAWQSLGGIVAVDMLLGNLDRINLHTGSFDNLPNIQWKRSGKKITGAIGLDTFDTAHPTTANLFELKIDDWKTECGEYLKDLGKAKTQIGEAMTYGQQDIQRIFGPDSCTWGAKEAKAFVDGYVAGVAKLKKKMKDEAPKLMKLGSAAPKGLMLRLNWLGWL